VILRKIRILQPQKVKFGVARRKGLLVIIAAAEWKAPALTCDKGRDPQ
jgi:hypothetical protein